jgi:hypothetical protein
MDASSALTAEIMLMFDVVKTGHNPYHYTIVLPLPVTQAVADVFNDLFGRRRNRA